MEINMNKGTVVGVAIASASVLAGMFIGGTLVRRSYKETEESMKRTQKDAEEFVKNTIKQEVVNEIKQEVVREIKQQIGVDNIIDRITRDVNSQIVDNVLMESKKDIQNFKNEVNKNITKYVTQTNDIIDRFDNTLTQVKNETLDMDARTVRLLRNMLNDSKDTKEDFDNFNKDDKPFISIKF